MKLPINKNQILVVFLIQLVVFLKAQEDQFTYCQLVPDWNDFTIDSTISNHPNQIMIISNRPYLPGEEEFLPNDIEEWRKINYFLAYCEGDRWHLTWVPDLKTGMDAVNNGKDFLFFIHGHGKSFPMSVNRASQVQMRYNINIILFDWPAQNASFNRSLSRVRYCGENFYNNLLLLRDYRSNYFKKDQKLSIFAHSLGNYFITHLVVNGNNQYLNKPFIDNIILNAPAVKAKQHNIVLSQLNFQKHIYVTLNEYDRVIRGAHLLMYGKLLGNFAYLPTAENTNYIHFTGIVNKQHTYFAGYHSFEYDIPSIFHTYYTIIHSEVLDLSNESYYVERSEGNGYNIKVDTPVVQKKD